MRWSGIKRPRYFFGKLLSVDDFSAEQEYALRKRRQHNLALHGAGIVSGLSVEVKAPGSNTVVVTPGFAIDPLGREIEITELVSLGITGNAEPLHIVVEYTERETDSVSTANGDEATRIEEGCRVVVAPNPSAEGVTLARLVGGPGQWRLDRSFQPARSRAACSDRR